MDPQPNNPLLQKGEIRFPNDNRAVFVRASPNQDPADLIRALEVVKPRTLLVLIGGANDLDQRLTSQIEQLFSRGLARAAADTGALIIDGGTESGVMALMGKAVADRERISPLLGVAPEGKVNYPGRATEEVIPDGAPLDPNHSHFVLVEGTEWSSGNDVMFKLASALSSGTGTVVAVLVNGGSFSKNEVLRCVRHEWPIVIFEGSGRLADEIASLSKERPRVDDPAMAEIIADGKLLLFPFDGSPEELRRFLNMQIGPDLREAWTIFAQYDFSAMSEQKWSKKILLFTLILGVMATVFAITEQSTVMKKFPYSGMVLRYLLIAVPIVISVLLTISNRLKPGKKWMALRGSAEAIKKEIFRYRTRVEEYGDRNIAGVSTRVSAEATLAAKIAAISKRLTDPDVNTASLSPYTGSLPPPTSLSNFDDGFTFLSAERYLTVRLSDQLNYYLHKAVLIGRKMRGTEWAIVIFGGVGTFLAALGDHLWIAVTTSIVTALTAYANHLQLEPMLIQYNQAARDLTNLRAWWNALEPNEKAKQAQKDMLVSKTERILEGEVSNWLRRSHAMDDLPIKSDKDKKK